MFKTNIQYVQRFSFHLTTEPPSDTAATPTHTDAQRIHEQTRARARTHASPVDRCGKAREVTQNERGKVGGGRC